MPNYRDFFRNNSEEELVNAVKNGLYVYMYDGVFSGNNSEKKLIDAIKYGTFYYEDGHETFFEAAVCCGSPAVVRACVEMGADVNCIDPNKALYVSPRAMSSSLVAAMKAYNPGTLRALLECGARTGILNGLLWDLKRNLLPEALHDEGMKGIKQRLDAGSEILKILREAGFNVPGMNKDDNEMSFHAVNPLYVIDGDIEDEDKGIEYKNVKEAVAAKKYVTWKDWDGKYADGWDDCKGDFDRYCEGVAERNMDEQTPSFPAHGTRPGALWHAISPEALRLMIEGGADVNATDAAGWTTMHHIIYHCNKDYSDPDAMLEISIGIVANTIFYSRKKYYFDTNAMLKILIDSGADVNARGRYGYTPLLLAIKCNNASMIHMLIEAGANLKDADEWGVTPLMASVPLDIEHPVFIDAGTDVNAKDKDGQTALMYAAKCGLWGSGLCNVDIARMLIDAGADVNALDNEGRTALEIAWNEHEGGEYSYEFIKLLIANGANPSLMSPEKPKYREYERRMLRKAGLIKSSSYPSFREMFAENSSDTIVNAIKNGLDLGIQDFNGEKFLDAALKYGAKEVVQACVDVGIYNGIDIKERLNGRITYEDCYVDADAIEIRLKADADPKIADKPDWNERLNTPPEADSQVPNFEQRSEQKKSLRKKFLNAARKQKTPDEELLMAAYSGNVAEIESALSRGANVNMRGESGYTPLMFASLNNRLDVVRKLIEAGADVNVQNDGDTALRQAMRKYNFDVARALLAAGADPKDIMEPEN